MKKFFSVLALICLGAFAIEVDGRLDEKEWLEAKKYDGFGFLGEDMRNVAVEQTEFRIVSKPDAVYIGVKCYESLMDRLKVASSDGFWGADSVELFLAPNGGTTEYYQFLITYANITCALYFEESGNIRPDPYAPVWKTAVHSGPDFWSAEIKFPLEAFYMTRQNLWKTTWRMNVCRTRTVGEKQRTTWSPVKRRFGETFNFRKVDGFPMRAPENDVFIRSAVGKVNEVKNGKPVGTVEVQVNAPRAAEYEFCGSKFNLKAGANTIKSDYTFDKEGRNQVLLSLKRVSDGKVFSRYYPMLVSFEPIKIRFKLPEYRRNFYPGQDHTKVTGTVERSGNEPVTLTLTGAGLKEKKLILKGDKMDFTFDTTEMKYGEAFLKATCGKYEKTEKIRRLEPKPESYNMSWISGGNLIVNGKPVQRRNMYSVYYMGGEVLKKKYDTDDLCLTKEVTYVQGWVEPCRLVPGIEAREATRDVKPCKEYFEKLDKTIANGLTGKYAYYCISDEPECRNISPVYLKHIYDYICEKDPYHVVLVVSRACSRYLDCADWFETHPYINARDEDGKRMYDREINTLGNYVEEISSLNRSDKCIGSMPTAFASRSHSEQSRYPNFAEMVCHTWAFIIRGSKTLFPYAYHDMGDVPSVYEGCRYIFTSSHALEEFILHGKRTLLFHNQQAGAALFELANGEKMFAAVNYTASPVTVSLKGVKGRFTEFRGDRSFRKFNKIELKPLEVIIGTTKKYDEGLKSYAEVSAEIDAKEKERCSTGNLLFERHADVEVVASRPTPRLSYKMFDGTRDVLAFYDVWGKNKFYEISFPKVDFIPTFSKVRIYGNNLGTPTVKIRKRGKWITLEPKNTVTEENMIEYDYGEDLRTVKLHIDFHKHNLELYEIELHK